MKADRQTEAALLEFLDRLCSRFAAGDAERLIRLVAPDADVAIVTSGEPLLRGSGEMTAALHRVAARYGGNDVSSGMHELTCRCLARVGDRREGFQH